MDWTELTITVPRAGAAAATDVATAIAADGLYIEDYADLERQVFEIAHVDLIEEELLQKPRDVVVIHLYLPPGAGVAETQDDLHRRLLAAGVADARLATRGLRQEDWENSWKQYYHPFTLGRRLAVAPSWESYAPPDSRALLRLDPGMAFGTGTHESTALCLELLDACVTGGEAVLDVGCGSGILAVAALLLGAGSALCIDIDPMAVRTAAENAALNGVAARLEARAGDLAAGAAGGYDVVTANIVADAILRLAPDVPPLLAPGGVFIASGIIDEREAEVCRGLEDAGLKVAEVRRKNGWVAVQSLVK